jgi:hypothetical protein
MKLIMTSGKKALGDDTQGSTSKKLNRSLAWVFRERGGRKKNPIEINLKKLTPFRPQEYHKGLHSSNPMRQTR